MPAPFILVYAFYMFLLKLQGSANSNVLPGGQEDVISFTIDLADQSGGTKPLLLQLR